MNLWGLFMALAIISALAMIGLVLLQQGKGADMGASLGGGGASGSLFGASGSANPLSKATAWAAGVFFASTLVLTYLGSQSRIDNNPNLGTGESVLGGLAEPTAVPAASAASAASVAIPAAVPAAAASVPAAATATAPASKGKN